MSEKYLPERNKLKENFYEIYKTIVFYIYIYIINNTLIMNIYMNTQKFNR